MMTLAPTDSAKCISRVSKARTSMRFAVAGRRDAAISSRTISTRSSVVKSGPLPALRATPIDQPIDDLGARAG